MKTRAFNFGAGPATLPESILIEAQQALLNWQESGMSILEIGHRTPEFQALLQQAELELRTLLTIPNNYHVLFLGGAARTQFSMLVLNFLQEKKTAGYLVSGLWSKLAFEEACKLKSAYVLASSEESQFLAVPPEQLWDIRDDTQYVFYTPNETVHGLRYPYVPEVQGLPLIADMTSCILSEPIQVTDYALIFAGAQKNIASAGMTLVIIRDEFLQQITTQSLPTMMDYRVQAAHHSLYATPPVFNCYLAAKMFQWIKEQGGIEALSRLNLEKSSRLYQYIDESSCYLCPIEPASRSRMNVCFSLRDNTLEVPFLHLASQRGLLALKGHRAVGGLRASLYNAMSLAGVDALIAFMQDFAKEYL